MIDILFCAKNRLAFTKASFETLLQNTSPSDYRKLWVVDDGSTDGTREYLFDKVWWLPNAHLIDGRFGAPAGIMNHMLSLDAFDAEHFAKIDNDVIVPPNWLSACARAMKLNPELDLLGIEPPDSRTPHFPDRPKAPCPELLGPIVRGSYAPCASIGGIGVMKRAAFATPRGIRPHSIYGGFTEWQTDNPRVIKGWAFPPLRVFLLDRLPIEPWASLSDEYIRNGWQREWTRYPKTVSSLWEWWRAPFA